MATVVEFTSPAAEFPLGTVFENLPTVTVELERLVPQGSSVIPYFWVRGAGAEDVLAAFEDHDGVRDIRLVDSVEDESLMRAEWDRGYVGVLSAIAAGDLAIMSGVGGRDGWLFEVRGESRDDVGAFRSYCQSHGVPIDVTAVHALLPIQGDGYGLTDTQREALVAAYEMGFFDSPRTASLEDVAADIGITQQSLSSRLRRGHRRLVEATLVQA
jgi:predicted DNA binding protein